MLYSIHLRHPFTMIITGPTGSGKTTFLKNLIQNASKICDKIPEQITYFYEEYQPFFEDFKDVRIVEGLDKDIISNIGGRGREWIVFDDLMQEASKDNTVSNLFTRGFHHRNLSIILLLQNIFSKGSESRNITLNCQYIVCFKNPRDKSIITNMARLMHPNKTKKFQEAYEVSTKRPYSYLFADLKPDTPEEVRLLSNIFGENGEPIQATLI